MGQESWVITVVLIPYRRFGTSYRPHLHGSRILGYYCSSVNSLPTFRDILSTPSSWVKNPGLLL